MASRTLSELDELDRIIDAGRGRVEVHTLCEVGDGRIRYPLRAVCLGCAKNDVPAIGFFGGVHGLERIGAQVLIEFLRELIARLGRDDGLERMLGETRLVFMPIVNPAGMSRGTRANANGVDLMRNAPIQSEERVTFLIGGQRLSARLPWFRGAAGTPMEVEADALCRLVHAELLSHPFSLALDCHSGFGLLDRIWFPHACTRAPFAHIAEVHALLDSFRQAHPHHVYVFEPQSRRYRTHGDLWDFLWLEARKQADGIFIPLTLEMGSWRWVRENPRQILSRHGMFNPLLADHAARVRRTHLQWLEFLCTAAHGYRAWLPCGEARERHERLALADWFRPAH